MIVIDDKEAPDRPEPEETSYRDMDVRLQPVIAPAALPYQPATRPYRPIVFMCPPDFFQPAPPDPVHGYANDFEKAGRKDFLKNRRAFRMEAADQWNELREVVSDYADVVLVEPVAGRHDQIYTADPSLSVCVNDNHGRPRIITILSDFSNAKRAPEVRMQRAAFEALNDRRAIIQSPHKLEGNGDNLPDKFRRVIWSGYTNDPGVARVSEGRSSLEGHTFLQEKTGIEVISLRTRFPFYHIDTVVSPLPRGHMLAHYESLHADSQRKFLTQAFDRHRLDPDEFLIPVSPEDARRLAANVRCFGNTVIMPECSRELQETVRSKGYDVTVVKIDKILAGGGGIHCVTNVVNELMAAPD